VEAIVGLGQSLLSDGGWNYAKANFTRLGRNLKSADLAYNAWVAFRIGEYTSRRSGSTVVDNLDKMDSLMLALGIPLRDVDQAWTTLNFLESDEKRLNKHAQSISRMMRVYDELYKKEDWQGVQSVLQDIQGAMVWMTPFERKRVLSTLKNRHETLPQSLLRRTIREQNLEASRRVGGEF
jgi:hypothetical protein